MRRLNEYDWLILTSVNGVKALWERLKHLKLNNESVEHLKVAAIGPATSSHRKARHARGRNAGRVRGGVRREASAKKVQGKRVLLVRAKVARDVIPRELRRAGAKVDVSKPTRRRSKASRHRLRARFAIRRAVPT